MLSTEENELICRVGPGTPMGDLMRRYWHPFLLVDELLDADGPPVRVRLLGEDLIAFRNTNGEVGLLDERCPHRGASLFFAINQECGMMCIYHGWKFDVNGDCVDMPSDLPGSTFKEKVHARAYPCIESAGVIWTYMGPSEKRPPAPNFIFNNLPEENVLARRVPIYCNYLQSLEGNIDSTHLGTLHVNYADKVPADLDTDLPGYCSQRFSRYTLAKYRYAKVDIQDTDYGFRLIAARPTDSGNQHIRINCHVLPYTSFIAGQQRGQQSVLIHVPADDENCFRISINFRPNQPFSGAERRERRYADSSNLEDDGKTRRNRKVNDWNINRYDQKHTILAGIWPFGDQDYAVTESMGPILDRTKEHLYGGDAAIIRVRQMLATAARNLQEGIEPPATNGDVPYAQIQGEEIIIGPDDDAWLIAANAGETAKRGERLL
ncbi:MAG: Rieske 2Fe-2S domain-containing protein [SAR202 cluster bacterium]|nr:Rieske 2Fe-2S domain-containing protein [SAR202 cluster bacterium]MQG76371.1 Rieske 2Fe-2S domain-containing protein [SAR202 cluster bacterium]